MPILARDASLTPKAKCTLHVYTQSADPNQRGIEHLIIFSSTLNVVAKGNKDWLTSTRVCIHVLEVNIKRIKINIVMKNKRRKDIRYMHVKFRGITV